MAIDNDAAVWNSLTYEEKNRQLYFRQKKMLKEFLKRGAISKAQYEKSLNDLTEKMGIQSELAEN